MNNMVNVSRSNLRQGAIYVMVGLIWGMMIPVSPFPRLALVAHIHLTGNGVMFLVAGLVILNLSVPKASVSAKILIAVPWLTWLEMMAEMANSWWGARNILSIAAAQAGATGAEPWQENIVTIVHLMGAIIMPAYWGIILVGLFRASNVPDSD